MKVYGCERAGAAKTATTRNPENVARRCVKDWSEKPGVMRPRVYYELPQTFLRVIQWIFVLQPPTVCLLGARRGQGPKKAAEEDPRRAATKKTRAAKAAKAAAAEDKAEATWQVEVARRLSTLTSQVCTLDPEILANVTEALQAADQLPIELIMKGKLKIIEREIEEDKDKDVS